MEKYEEIKENLKNFKKIIVTGPQRSGTRFTANIIAYDLGYNFIDETEFGITKFHKFMKLTEKENICIQCPALSDKILEFPDDVLIIFMRRDINDIIKSQNRIGWFVKGKSLYTSGLREQKVYEKFINYFDKTIPISQLKYNVWDNFQKPRVNNWIDLEYESLKEHKLWKTKIKRINHEWNQIK